jgi:hypothetical protein
VYLVSYFTLHACHGDRLVSARPGSVGGLSQPRRDSADPKTIDYLTFSTRRFNNQFQKLPRATEQFNRQNIADSLQLINLFFFFSKNADIDTKNAVFYKKYHLPPS